MKNIKFSRLFAAMMFVAVLVFTGCQYPKYNVSIVGTWDSATNEHWVITAKTVDTSGTGYLSYAGNNLVLVMDDDNSGYLFIKYTRAANSSWEYVSDATQAPDIGKWYAIHFKDLTNTSVRMSGAYKAGGATSKATLEEAMTEFTVANGYFAAYSDFTRQ